MARATQAHQSNQASQTGKTILFNGPSDVALPRLVLVVCVIVLTVFGLVMVFSSSTIEAINEGAPATTYLTKQLVVAVVGLVAAGIIGVVPYYVWLDWWVWIPYTLAIVLLLLTAAIGTAELGAQRWLTLGPISFQPSELAKPAFVLMMARILYKGRIEENYDLRQTTMMVALLVGIPLALLYVTQSDLGTTVICFVGILVCLWLSDVPWYIFVAVFVGVLVFGLIAVFGTGYRADRLSYLNPQEDYYGSGYQLVRSFYAFAEGGLFGVGLGNSTEKYLYLPEAETDFIFAIIAEELGMVGAVAVVLLFLAVLWAGLRIARSAPDLFATMVAGACTVMLVFQAFLNMACVVGLIPTTGKPLPFISAGGSSLFGSYLLVGLILSVSMASGDASGVFERRRNDLVVIRSGAARRSGQAAKSSRTSSRTSKSAKTSGTARGESARAAARNRRRRS